MKEMGKMVAKLHEINGDTATIVTEKNYTVIIPVQMIPQGAKPGDLIYLEFKAEPNHEMSFKRIIELENDYIHRYY
ncbi:transcription termination factor Rho [Anaerosolibacter carboniphilus]|uniref:Transcription termination factor Rho n=2 Tax=Anaerosolibacter carboniphilus TaxID=1417629 RepID=A0A841L0K5_9FIRM|nr:transcription termination factor Rho [Anaerosolibacter carboniphilus]